MVGQLSIHLIVKHLGHPIDDIEPCGHLICLKYNFVWLLISTSTQRDKEKRKDKMVFLFIYNFVYGESIKFWLTSYN